MKYHNVMLTLMIVDGAKNSPCDLDYCYVFRDKELAKIRQKIFRVQVVMTGGIEHHTIARATSAIAVR